VALTTADYQALTDDLQEVFNEASMTNVASWKGKDVFQVKDTDRKTYDYLGLHGVGGFARVAEGGQLPVVSSSQGDTATFTQKRHGSRVSITKDMRMFDLHDQMTEIVRSEVDYAFSQIDQSMADVILNGFTGTTYEDVYGETVTNLSPDGVVLFSASHSNNINADMFRNLIRNSAGTANPGLSRDAIVTARKDAKTYKDPNGTVRPCNLDMLIVTPTNEDLAERLLFSSGVQGTPNVDINPLKGKVSKLMVWERLEVSGQGTDTSKYWFMADSAKVGKSLQGIFAQKPMMHDATNVHDSLNWEYPVDAYYTLGIGFPRFIFGGTGVN